MSALYVDSSAVLAWLLGESRANEVRARLDACAVVATSVLTLLESQRALNRAESEGLIRAAEAQKLRGLLARVSAGWVTMEISGEVRDLAARRFPAEPVRMLDAIHLATAILFLRAYPDLEFLTFDRRISANAGALGLEIGDVTSF